MKAPDRSEMLHTRPSKVLELDQLADHVSTLRGTRRVVHCHGVFDLLHLGHIRHFEAAKKLGDVLVVTITANAYVNKGPHRPVFSEELRAEAIASLECVDFVAINRSPTAVDAIARIKPAVYAKGADYRDAAKDRTGGITLEENAVKAAGGEIVFTDELAFSSSNLINRHLSVFSKEISEYLDGLAPKYPADSVLQHLEQVRGLKTLVIGETIIDEYQYCETIGKSGKEPILAARYVSTEQFAGGVLAVANQVAAFSDHVGVLTFLGSQDSHEDYIRKQLDPKIEPVFLYQQNAPTIVKRRFVETYPFQKIFEVYVMNDGDDDGRRAEALDAELARLLPLYDLVIVADYGHGMIGQAAVDRLCREAKFLAVNTQVNADNRGFNTLSKYHRADYACVSENEVRLDVRSRRRPIEDIVLELQRKLACGRLFITRGADGCVCFERPDRFFRIPAFTGHVVDRVGAGDAVLSVTSLCAARGVPMELIGFIGSAVGSQAVGTVGHRSRIERLALYRHIESLLK